MMDKNIFTIALVCVRLQNISIILILYIYLQSMF